MKYSKMNCQIAIEMQRVETEQTWESIFPNCETLKTEELTGYLGMWPMYNLHIFTYF